MMKRIFVFILLFVRLKTIYALSLTLVLKSADTMQLLEGAYGVVSQSNRVIGNLIEIQRGKYRVDFSSEGDYRFKIIVPGFKTKEEAVRLTGDRVKTIYLIPDVRYRLGEIEVIGNKDLNQSSKVTLNKEVLKGASKGVFLDPIEPLKRISGTVSDDLYLNYNGRNFAVSKLKVRGGSYYENLAVCEGALLKYPYHVYFPDSVFQEDLVQSVSLYKGVLPVEYGQSLSSLLNVRLMDPIEGFHGKFNAGVLNSSLSVSSMTPDGNFQYLAGVKINYMMFVDDIVNGISALTRGNNTNMVFVPMSAPYYMDTTGKMVFKAKHHRFSFLWSFSFDPYFYNNIFSSGYDALNSQTYRGVFNLNWSFPVFGRGILKNSLSYGPGREIFDRTYTNYESYSSNENATFYRQQKEDDYYSLKSKIDFVFSEDWKLQGGFDFLYYPNITYYRDVLVYSNFHSNTSVITNIIGEISNRFERSFFVPAFFSETSIRFFKGLIDLNPGLRLNYYQSLDQYETDLRLNLSFYQQEGDKFYFSVGTIHQLPTVPEYLEWISFDQDFRVPGVVHYILGINRNIFSEFDLNFEAYFKDYYHVLTAVSFQSNLYVKTSGSEKKIYGYDFILTKKKSKNSPFYGWLSLSSYWTYRYRKEGLLDLNQLVRSDNSSMAFLENYPMVSIVSTVYLPLDTPPIEEWYLSDRMDYKLNIIVAYDILRNLTLLAEFGLRSGKYYTPIIGVSNNVALYGDYKSEKLPDFHSLNLKMNWSFPLWESYAGLSLQINNVYNHLQVLAVQYSAQGEKEDYVTLFAGIYPVLNFWMEW